MDDGELKELRDRVAALERRLEVCERENGELRQRIASHEQAIRLTARPADGDDRSGAGGQMVSVDGLRFWASGDEKPTEVADMFRAILDDDPAAG
jgi:hypothetical protein